MHATHRLLPVFVGILQAITRKHGSQQEADRRDGGAEQCQRSQLVVEPVLVEVRAQVGTYLSAQVVHRENPGIAEPLGVIRAGMSCQCQQRNHRNLCGDLRCDGEQDGACRSGKQRERGLRGNPEHDAQVNQRLHQVDVFEVSGEASEILVTALPANQPTRCCCRTADDAMQPLHAGVSAYKAHDARCTFLLQEQHVDKRSDYRSACTNRAQHPDELLRELQVVGHEVILRLSGARIEVEAGKEYAETGITINGLAPAVIKTAMNENTDPKQLEFMLAKIPMKRLGTIEEVAAMSAWIVSKECSFSTGFVFDISGGRATY